MTKEALPEEELFVRLLCDVMIPAEKEILHGQSAKKFDYLQPTQDTLAGIHVEVSDSRAENRAAEWKPRDDLVRQEPIPAVTTTCHEQRAQVVNCGKSVSPSG